MGISGGFAEFLRAITVTERAIPSSVDYIIRTKRVTTSCRPYTQLCDKSCSQSYGCSVGRSTIARTEDERASPSRGGDRAFTGQQNGR